MRPSSTYSLGDRGGIAFMLSTSLDLKCNLLLPQRKSVRGNERGSFLATSGVNSSCLMLRIPFTRLRLEGARKHITIYIHSLLFYPDPSYSIRRRPSISLSLIRKNLPRTSISWPMKVVKNSRSHRTLWIKRIPARTQVLRRSISFSGNKRKHLGHVDEFRR